MGNESTDYKAPTRRECLISGGAAISGSLLAGCTGSGGSEGATNNSNGTSGSSGNTATSGGSSYSVRMAPVGKVEFNSVPERLFVCFPQYADMAVALGHGGGVNALFSPKFAGTTMDHYCARLPDVSFDWQGLRNPLTDGLTKEQLYNLDSDVHFLDPAYASTEDGWNQDDMDEIRATIGPWFGNFYSGTHARPPAGYRQAYQYYSLWEMFGKVARVFREQERYRALNRVHENVLSTIQSKLPPKGQRPTAVRVTLGEGQFYTYHLNKPGYWLADTRPLGAIDAFGGQNWSDLWGTVGYEAMLEADPDVILHLWGITPDYAVGETIKQLKSHPVGKQLTAVKNDQVYAHGMRYQGPIMNLFQLEMTAKQLYPEQFGEWPEYKDGDPYPKIPKGEQLFDRNRVGNIINGNI